MSDELKHVYYNNGLYDGQREASMRLQFLDRAMTLCDGTGLCGENRAVLAIKLARMIEEYVARKP